MSAAGLVLFIVGGFFGQLAAAVAVELVRPWLAHVVRHARLRTLAGHMGARVHCDLCSQWIDAKGPRS